MKRKLKVVMLGEGRVGKTSLLHRFLKSEFDENCPSTVKANMYANSRMEVNGQIADVAVWDTAGQERFRTITSAYYRGADGIIMVYDVTNVESFENVKNWLKEVEDHASEDTCKLMIGNKNDCTNKAVPYTKAKEMADSLNMPIIETSAKTSDNVEDAFVKMATVLLENAEKNEGETQGNKTRNILAEDGLGKKPKKCCKQ